MSRDGRDRPLRSRPVAGRLDLNVPEHFEEAGASAEGQSVMVAGSPLDDGLSELVEEVVQMERVASSVNVVGAGFTAGGPALAAASEHGFVLRPLSPPVAERRSEVGKDDPSYNTLVRWHYR